MKRKLAAILIADVVGYSRMMAEDDEATLTTLRSFRKSVFDPAIRESGGHIIKLMGDGALVEFASVADAVRCAISVQKRNEADAAGIRLRIGVHLGEVISEGNDIYGDGVNVAARLEALAEPGGICISAVAFQNLDKRGKDAFHDGGEHNLKNIPEPVRVFTWARDLAAVAAASDRLELPDKPSIAVLPFDNMSGDPEQDYIADGIAEDIITALSRSPWLFVIARNSSFLFRGQSIDLKSVAQKLGIRYVLEGSIRKAGTRVRITAQLIDGITGSHVWAEKYDASTDDIFELQDEITRSVVASLHTQIVFHEGEVSATGSRTDLGTRERQYRAFRLIYEMRMDTLLQGIALVEALNAEFGESGERLAQIAVALIHQYHLGLTPDDDGSLRRRALDLAERSVTLDSRYEGGRWVSGFSRLYLGDHAGAEAELRAAIRLNPNYALAYGTLGTVLAYSGESDESIRNNEIAMRINPLEPNMYFRQIGMAIAHFVAGRYRSAVEWARRTTLARPEYDVGHALLVASLTELGETENAARAMAAFRARHPDATCVDFTRMPFRDPAHRNRIIDALKKAGLPD